MESTRLSLKSNRKGLFATETDCCRHLRRLFIQFVLQAYRYRPTVWYAGPHFVLGASVYSIIRRRWDGGPLPEQRRQKGRRAGQGKSTVCHAVTDGTAKNHIPVNDNQTVDAETASSAPVLTCRLPPRTRSPDPR